MTNIVLEIADELEGLLGKNVLPLAKGIAWQTASIYAPNLLYSENGIHRLKRPQEQIFIHSSGGLGVDSTFSFCTQFIPEYVKENSFSKAALTSLNNSITKDIDHKIAFFPELNTCPVEVVSLVKTIVEENGINVKKGVQGGFVALGQYINSEPGLVVNSNWIPKSYDKPLLSRFDQLYQLFPTKEVWDDISSKMLSSIGRGDFNNKKSANPLSSYKKDFIKLKKEHDKKQKLIVCFDMIRESMGPIISKGLKMIEDDPSSTIFSRDSECFFRRINTSAWLSRSEREVKNKGGFKFIYANDVDLEEGEKAFFDSINNKRSLFSYLKLIKKKRGKTKDKAHEYYKKNYDKIKDASYKVQAEYMKRHGFDVSAMTLNRWSKDIKL